MAIQQAREADARRTEAAALAAALATVDRIAAAPKHASVALLTADGRPGGSVSWSSDELVILASALPPPASGSRYRCFLERHDGVREPIGWMWYRAGIGFWAADLDEWDTGWLHESGRLVVALEAEGGGSAGPALLAADLPG